MNFTIDKENELAIFRLKETRLDSLTSPALKAELLILSQEAIQVLIIDLSSVEFCDSTGLSALLLAERQLREKDGGVLIVDAIGKVRTLIEVAKLDAILPVFPTVDVARNALED
ncbi:MAG: STAS domain-containing protein [Ignavibacteriae bacterium]|nr:STAS domain-containing protein [Ignavibacteriota bacterium]